VLFNNSVERMFHLLTKGQNSADIAQWMQDFNAGKAVTLPLHLVDSFKAVGLSSVKVSDAAAAAAMKHIYNSTGGSSSYSSSSSSSDSYVIDPHTAVGVAAALQLQAETSDATTTDKHVPLVCMGCAHPAKFVDTVATALELTIEQAHTVMPDQQHKCVAATVTASNGLDAAAVRAEGSVSVFKQGDDWLSMLKDIITGVTAAAEQ
jgi:threonine synthase